jgi:polysaccharide deacetylase family protein (PEP-CTERM system associated)
MHNALTFDVEEYFQVEAFSSVIRKEQWDAYPSRVADSTRRLLDLLARRAVRATFFVLGWVAARHIALVRDIGAAGHELACHGYAHRPIYTMTPDAFREDVRRGKRAVEDAAGTPVLGYRAPTFSVVKDCLWALEILAQEGFVYDSSIFPIIHDRYGIRDAHRFPHQVSLAHGALVEFPITTVQIAGHRLPLCGGGYFRLAPYRLVRAGLHRVNRHEGKPAIVYLHPWEMDPGQPRAPVGYLTRLRHSVNIHRTAAKLERLLADFPFAPVGEVLREQGLLENPS